jgi:hypothetical protein
MAGEPALPVPATAPLWPLAALIPVPPPPDGVCGAFVPALGVFATFPAAFATVLGAASPAASTPEGV